MGVVGVVGTRYRVQPEDGAGALVAGIGGHHRKALVKRVAGAGARSDSRLDDAVIAASALVQETPVPLAWQAQFETDVVGLAVRAGALGHAARDHAVRCQQVAGACTGRSGRIACNGLGFQRHAGPGAGDQAGAIGRLCLYAPTGRGECRGQCRAADHAAPERGFAVRDIAGMHKVSVRRSKPAKCGE